MFCRKRCSCKFHKIRRKHLRYSLFFNIVVEKETLVQVLSCEFCEIFKNTLFTENLWMTASLERYFSVNFVKFSRKCSCRTPPSNHFSHDVFFFLFAYQPDLQPKINLFGGAIVNWRMNSQFRSIL